MKNIYSAIKDKKNPSVSNSDSFIREKMFKKRLGLWVGFG